MKSLVLLFLLGVVAVSQAMMEDLKDDDEFLDFQARFRKFEEMKKGSAVDPEELKELEGMSREKLLTALNNFLPDDLDEREPALEKLFAEMMEREFKGQGEEGEDMMPPFMHRGHPFESHGEDDGFQGGRPGRFGPPDAMRDPRRFRNFNPKYPMPR